MQDIRHRSPTGAMSNTARDLVAESISDEQQSNCELTADYGKYPQAHWRSQEQPQPVGG
jgi:hypothetical protein